MKQLTQAQLALAVVFGLASLQGQAADTPKTDAPISAIQDWSSRSVIHRKAMFPDEFLRVGEMENLYKDPRYVASVLRRVESELPSSAQLQRTISREASKATNNVKCTDRRRGHCPSTPDPESPEDSPELRDWSNVLGGGVDGQGGNGIQGMFPAKYNFNIFAPADCASDFVVYPTNAAGATQSGTRQEQWSGAVTANSNSGETITIGLAGQRQVVLRARSTTLVNDRDFLIGATAISAAQNLRDAVNRWTGETGFRATLTGTTVTIISNSAGNIDNASISNGLTGFTPSRTYPGTGTTTPGQPTIIAFNQLYDTKCNFGQVNPGQSTGARINDNAPNVKWSYNTGTGYITETSPVLSYLDDGKQVAFVQRNGDSLQLVILKPGGGSGSAASPVTPVFVANASYRGCSNPGGCYTTITFSTAQGANNNSAGGQTWSAPFVDYATDTLWAGDGNGILHKFDGVFQGTPSEATGGFPKIVQLGRKLSPPVYAGGSVYVGSASGSGSLGGKLHRVNASTGALFSSIKLAVEESTGIREAVIVDNFTGSVFAFLFNDGTQGNATDCAPTDPQAGNFDACRVVARFATNFANNAAPLQRAYVGRGNSRVSALYAGAFDDAYYNSTDATGAMYIVGGEPSQTYRPTLWKIPLTAGVMGAPQRGAQVGDNLGCGAQPNCSNGVYDMSPVTVIKNPNTGVEHLFFSMPKDATAGTCTGACLYMYSLNGTWGPTNTPVASLPVSSGTSGIIIDNVRPGADTGTSQIYFAQLDSAVRKRWTMTFANGDNTNAGTFSIRNEVTATTITFTGNTSATSCTGAGGTFNMSGTAKEDAIELRACLLAANLPGYNIAGENGTNDGSVVVTYAVKGTPADNLVVENIAGTGNVIVITEGTGSTAGNAIQVSQSALQ